MQLKQFSIRELKKYFQNLMKTINKKSSFMIFIKYLNK